MTGQTDEGVRRSIRDAMDRLIAGKPLYSGGKLTVKDLAAEARIKRWVLTHRHTDLQDEFRARIANGDSQPPATQLLQAKPLEAEKKIKALTAEASALKATIHQLERIINVLALENRQLRGDRERSRVVTPLERRGP
jgi:hypothetical protein